ncbi:MAG TPA: glycosyltransferase family 4 protein [Gemmatimonadales bacterium]|nr:glycosyltransferase family 4 protein [Gemmatimonadales bacterium]
MTTRVALVCSGLGTVRRGYEAFAQGLFDALSGVEGLDVWLFKGAGARTPREIPLWHLPRSGFPARLTGELTRRGPYVMEQATLTVSLIPWLRKTRPDVVYYCDPSIGRLLWQWRKLTGPQFRLIMHNGGPHPPPFRWADHVHQLTPVTLTEALSAGVPPERQTLLPCGFSFGPPPQPMSMYERSTRRRALGLPVDRPLVLSVGALNRGHKRMDYLITEIASMGEARPFLVMLGESEDDTPAVRALAELLLGPEGFQMRTVPRERMDEYYRAADVFALASLTEAFGLAYVEALAHGLPTIAHDQEVTRFVMGKEGTLADLRRPDALAAAVRTVLQEGDRGADRERRHEVMRARFGWPALLPGYVTMLAPSDRAQAPAPRAPVAAGVAG